MNDALWLNALRNLIPEIVKRGGSVSSRARADLKAESPGLWQSSLTDAEAAMAAMLVRCGLHGFLANKITAPEFRDRLVHEMPGFKADAEFLGKILPEFYGAASDDTKPVVLPEEEAEPDDKLADSIQEWAAENEELRKTMQQWREAHDRLFDIIIETRKLLDKITEQMETKK